ncbi:unnamed protein product [Adineta steineri]|uniref:Glucose-methanol-choline oxidoreductase C-terminal domain-containing protein n=1 Tax=Adineta steineri TaxID=433720 RepID=A0A819E5G6_9BILA|nr:unnamed protein product [Adineta steineri]CAF3844491.1 unnamed protein product [Adineta steineri]
MREVFKPHLSDGNQWSIICLPTLLHPKSKGEITLTSRNPLEHPIINPHYLEEKDDVRKLIEACKLVDKIFQTEPFKDVIKPTAEEMNEDNRIDNEDHFWELYVRKYSVTSYHPIGTCRMGREENPMTVVTVDTRVKGVKGIRVVDASIIPESLSGNANIPTIAMAERAADLIKINDEK